MKTNWSFPVWRKTNPFLDGNPSEYYNLFDLAFFNTLVWWIYAFKYARLMWDVTIHIYVISLLMHGKLMSCCKSFILLEYILAMYPLWQMSWVTHKFSTMEFQDFVNCRLLMFLCLVWVHYEFQWSLKMFCIWLNLNWSFLDRLWTLIKILWTFESQQGLTN
jgi:hypothetical protein